MECVIECVKEIMEGTGGYCGCPDCEREQIEENKEFCSGCKKGSAFFSSCDSGLQCSICNKEIKNAKFK